MATEMTFIVEYRCSRCGVALQARSSQSYGWLRCPRCGRASLPPEHMRASRPDVPVPPGDDVLVIVDDRPGRPATGRPATGRPATSWRRGSFRRISGATAMFLSLLIALLAVLERDRSGAWAFTLIALACLVFSIYPSRPRAA